jgi:hypothetical protein
MRPNESFRAEARSAASSLTLATLGMTMLACTAQRDEGSKPANTGAVHIRREVDYPLDPTRRPFHLVVDAVGPNVDSLTVHLRIADPDRKPVYDKSWPSAGYLECECDDSQRPGQLPGLRTDAKRYLETFFDSAFTAPAPDTGRYWERPDHRMSILLHLIPQMWDVSKVRDTSAVIDSIGREKPTSYDAAADKVRAGIRSRPAIVYRTALEGYCIAAWSPELGRVIDILCGP